MKLGLQHLMSWTLLVPILSLAIPNCAQQPAASNPLLSDELAVYATVLDSLGSSSRILIADNTSTFSCSKSICNGFSIGECNGLREKGESPDERMEIVKRDLPELDNDTIKSFEGLNEACSVIQGKMPTRVQYYFFSDPDIPKDWKYSYLVYFSRVGFNAQHNQALVYVGLLSGTDGALSKGKYILLTMKAQGWTFVGNSAVWELNPIQ